ncbi:type IV pili methyl-accepting chemotaxis transducer N-terminal domain-containing protein [Parathalassolituus penaei]|uniref:Type IV pili methyl-accepting chemotaxis transducer N-terminal domain-containing protein n=1 Tax=Parathalassolituus penaei TaxID=2997323 RepID=A0A9X3ITF4_9GAMM|nr:type IV pili methyl-accepting chemotaxis transducer N-terminal domain-containing protein [Parathalassolituus penaei]MCY0966260.1 type IV pili methyl-accepting chemotaxis transducer N-terminal domain-containing protein [Parathalassolituus penaei]
MLSLGILVFVLLAGTAVWFLNPGRPRTNDFTPARLINLAGSLRMLSQRTMKNWLMLGAGHNPDEANRQLLLSVDLFDERLLLLKRWALTPGNQYLVSRVEQAWSRFRGQVCEVPQRDRIQALMRECNDLLYVCDELVEAVVSQSGQREATLVNVAGRQRMLLQRIAKNCMAMSWGLSTETVRHELLDAIDLFEASLQALRNSRFNSAALNEELEMLDHEWQRGRPHCQQHCSGRCTPNEVLLVTDAVQAGMDRVTAMYQQLMDGSSQDVSDEFVRSNLAERPLAPGHNGQRQQNLIHTHTVH